MGTARDYTSGNLLPDNKTFLVIGGKTHGGTDISSCEKLNVAANTWSSAGSLSKVRDAHSSVLFKNNVIVLGGWTGAYLNTCEQYDPVTNMWSSFTSFSTPRHSSGSAVALNKIYLAGGFNGGVLASVEVYSGTSWSFLLPSLAQARDHCSAISFQNKFVVLGGTRTTIEVFDPVTSSWNTTFPPMKISPTRYRPAIVSF